MHRSRHSKWYRANSLKREVQKNIHKHLDISGEMCYNNSINIEGGERNGE